MRTTTASATKDSMARASKIFTRSNWSCKQHVADHGIGKLQVRVQTATKRREERRRAPDHEDEKQDIVRSMHNIGVIAAYLWRPLQQTQIQDWRSAEGGDRSGWRPAAMAEHLNARIFQERRTQSSNAKRRRPTLKSRRQPEEKRAQAADRHQREGKRDGWKTEGWTY